MNNMTKYVVLPVVIGSITVTGVSTIRMKMVQHENAKLKDKLERKIEAPVAYKTSIEDIQEINRKNVDMIVYESGYSDYELVLQDNGMFGINTKLKTKFKYIVTVDMSRAKIMTVNDTILVNVDLEDIHLKEVVVKEPKLNYDTNFLTRFRGQHIINLEASMIAKCYEEIDEVVNKDFKENQNQFKLNLINKLNKIYDSNNVKVNVN